MEKFLVAVTIALALLTIVATRFGPFSRDGGDAARLDNQLIPPGSALLLVSGWSEPELTKILGDFSANYSLPPSTFRATRSTAAIHEVAFEAGLDSGTIFFLVNYVSYPQGFDLEAKQLAAAAKIELSDATGIPPGSQRGETAWIYVPADDTDYDLVYALTADRSAYEISFTDLKWRRRDTDRLPALTQRLIDEASAR